MSYWNSINSKALKSLVEFVLEVEGTSDSRFGRLYRDEMIEIYLRGQCQGLEVVRVCPVAGSSDRNPVLIWDKNGTLIRTHGEFNLIRNHLGAIAREALGEE